MGYALNLCKFHIYHVPYNHNATEEGMEMAQNRIRIVDVADTLDLRSMASKESNPSLTTIHQEANLRQLNVWRQCAMEQNISHKSCCRLI